MVKLAKVIAVWMVINCVLALIAALICLSDDSERGYGIALLGAAPLFTGLATVVWNVAAIRQRLTTSPEQQKDEALTAGQTLGL